MLHNIPFLSILHKWYKRSVHKNTLFLSVILLAQVLVSVYFVYIYCIKYVRIQYEPKLLSSPLAKNHKFNKINHILCLGWFDVHYIRCSPCRTYKPKQHFYDCCIHIHPYIPKMLGTRMYTPTQYKVYNEYKMLP